jgi:hypothetical protein
MSSAKRTAYEVGALLSNVTHTSKGLQPWELPQSVLGRLRRAGSPRYSEYASEALLSDVKAQRLRGA